MILKNITVPEKRSATPIAINSTRTYTILTWAQKIDPETSETGGPRPAGPAALN